MKILQIIQKSQLRGAEIFACQLSSELIMRGHDVHIICLFGEEGPLHARFSHLRIQLLGRSQSLRMFDVRGYKDLAKIIEKGKYEIVQANAGDTLKYAVFSKFIFGWKGRLIFRNANKMSDFIRGIGHRIYNKFLLSQCDYVVSVSDWCRKDLIDFFPKLESISKTITIGTYDFSDITPVGHDCQSRPIIVNISSFVPEKNHQFVLDVFNVFFRRFNTGYLWLVGEGKLMEETRQKVQQLGIEDRVVFWGARTDAVSILKAADVLLLPSKIEGLPGVILEALSTGVLVISSRVGGISEVIDDGETGYSLADFDIEQYVEKLSTLLGDNDRNDSILRKGKLRIEENFTMARVAEAFELMYKTQTTKGARA